MATLWQETDRKQLFDRVRKLTPEQRPLWGKMAAHQMMAHVNDALRASLGELKVKPKWLPFRYPPLQQLIIYAAPIPRNAPTAPELLLRIDKAQWADEQKAFPQLVARFAAIAPDAAWPEHGAFGHLSRRAWGVLMFRHTDHHFRQFGI